MATKNLNLGRVPVSRGEFNLTTTYYKDNIVQYQSASYQVTTESITGVTPINPEGVINTGWTLFSGSLYAYRWRTTDTPASDGKTEGNLKDLYQSTLDLDDKVTELELNSASCKTPIDEVESDLDIADGTGNVIARLAQGHIKTKKFDSKDVIGAAIVSDISDPAYEEVDLEIRDSNGNGLARFYKGNIQTKAFDGLNIINNIKDINNNIKDINNSINPELQNFFDYNTARKLPKAILRNIIEIASAGRCTVIWDRFDNPNLMYKIPVMSLGQIDTRYGDMKTPHPAFIVNGERIKYIYIACFMASKYNEHWVSWFGLSPEAGATLELARSWAEEKGTGWHLETIYERNVACWLSQKVHGDVPRGNTCYGRSHESGYEYEYVEQLNGLLSGSKTTSWEPSMGEQNTGARWINGTQPDTWSHNNSRWGIFDLIGGFHEWCDLVKVKDGQIIISEDNSFNGEESNWINTGIYFDFIDGDRKKKILTSSTPVYLNDTKGGTDWADMKVSDNYNNADIKWRKLMDMLMFSPKINYEDTVKHQYKGYSTVTVKNDGSEYYCMQGGALEYQSGFGHYYFDYMKDMPDHGGTGHNNMGFRFCFIDKNI